MTSEQLAQCYQAACIEELQALKPGNVHIFADGHRMVVSDFLQSAEASAVDIAAPNLTVGARIFNAVESTQKRVGMNTNLGIILLCAPLIHSVLQAATFPATSSAPNPAGRLQALQKNLNDTLENLTVADAILTAKAIMLAQPAGLKSANAHDVRDLPTITLLEMMQHAQQYDRIAWQYAHQFSDILDFGLNAYQHAMAQWQSSTWAATWVYLSFLCEYADTHIVRKYDANLAAQIQQEALTVKAKIIAIGHPKLLKKTLFEWDAALKLRNVNPGTSADLTVATLLAVKLM